ncbi:hypothetical protein WJX73_001127 [Symbiochloris irregularis]|uniref:Lipoxygenase n=1 Tax=Symbiochloris irregularis TaxID=706552 RepID=A0AAW1NMC5_9CHLO
MPFGLSAGNDVLLQHRAYHCMPDTGGLLGIDLQRSITQKGLRQAELEFYLWGEASVFLFCQILTDMQSGGAAFYQTGHDDTGRTVVIQFFHGMPMLLEFARGAIAGISPDAGEDDDNRMMKLGGFQGPIVQVSLKDFDSRKAEIAAELWRAATEVGFFYLKDTGIDAAEMEMMLDLAEAFFRLPTDTKAKTAFDMSRNAGWESGRQKRASHNLPELKESMQLKWHNMQGKWPSDEDLAGFQQTCQAFMRKCQEVSLQVLTCFAIGLGFEEDFFTKNHDVRLPDCQQTLRLMHYFSVEGKRFPEGFPRAGSHCDFETITLLFARGAGLEVCPGRESTSEHAHGDEWTECPAIPGAITVNIGDALMRWSDDALKSNYHRVRMPLPGESRGSRFSIAYFNQANKSAVIEGKKGIYPPISAEDFCSRQLKRAAARGARNAIGFTLLSICLEEAGKRAGCTSRNRHRFSRLPDKVDSMICYTGYSALGQHRFLTHAAYRPGGSGSASVSRRGRLQPTCADRFDKTDRDSIRSNWRIKTLLKERPVAPSAPDKPAGRPQEKQPEDRVVDACIVMSKRKQWGAVRLEVKLIDDEGHESSPQPATIFTPPFSNAERSYTIQLSVPSKFGKVAALIVSPKISVSGQHARSIFLDRVETQDQQSGSKCIIWCHSWVSQTQGDRIFFSNQACLPQTMNPELRKLRDQELRDLRGEKLVKDEDTGKSQWQPDLGVRQPLDRIYDYQVYNDMSEPGFSPGKAGADRKVRPTLGKDPNLPGGPGPYCYPRHMRTGLPLHPGTDQQVYSGSPYLPLDERFDDRKNLEFGFDTVYSLLPWAIEQILPWRRMRPLTGFDDVAFIYQNAWKAMMGWLFVIPGLPKLLRLEVLPPLPLVAYGRSTLWDDDSEFGRQVVAGVNPCALEAVTDYEKWQKLSTIRDEQLSGLLEHGSLKEAIEDPEHNIFVIDHATALLSTLTKDSKSTITDQINNQPGWDVFQYAPRCLLHRSRGGRLRPIAVELCLPHEEPLVITANDDPLRWRLAKGHFLAANSGHHQIISHFLRTHACTEPIIIATHRCLGVQHPLFKALYLHIRYTLNINERARTGLVNGGGVIETAFNPGKVGMPMSAKIYESWRFDEQALPADLLARGMLQEDAEGPVKWKGKTYSIVMGADYPYAADGMLLWDALHDWQTAYLSTYYKTQADFDNDTELHAWWDEIKHKGHADITEGWPELRDLNDLVDITATIAWIASGHHAAVNFGQYAYTGYFPNFPTVSRQSIPPLDTIKWQEMRGNHDRAFLDTFSDKKTALQILGVVRLLSTHDEDEEYIATRPDEATWTSSKVDREHWKAFQKSIRTMETTIEARNADPALKHRYLNYELLLPDLGSKPQYNCGPPARGVPNSISI